MQASHTTQDLLNLITRIWGFGALRPLQEEAMLAALEQRDSLVVLPTGGGKSLCFQAPAVLLGGTTVVISPLLALMKDQVDGLQANGIAAAQLTSEQDASERRAVEADLRAGKVNILYVSPEKLFSGDYLCDMLARVDLKAFVIDEAHCISHWGHDFRKEYRKIGSLRQRFPEASMHAYTATAIEQVRADIVRQLHLHNPLVLVGNFDRPNLIYRIWPRDKNEINQVMQVIESNEGEAGVIYCMRRADVDSLAAELQRKKVKAQPYHAGMSMEQRRRVQEEFASEKCDIVVATIAFGMGIDRSNVRFVIHTAMPKSLESYQQETGRAGRDGLPASCVLLYSGADVVVAKKMLQKTAEEGGSQAHLPIVLKHLDEMDRYARGAICRHKALVNHFGQEYELPSCGACDICLGDCEQVKDAIVVAQKILSCVARVKSGFGIMHVISILRGKATENVRKRGHETLKTFGILSDQSEDNLRDWIYQLIGQNVLVQTEDEYPKLQLNEASWEVMRNQREVKLVQLKRRKKGDKKTKTFIEPESLTGEDQKIFDDMRQLRKKLATERQIPPYVVFADMVLREMIRHKPDSLAAMRLISGVGDQKLRDYGQAFLEVIQEHCRNHRGPHTMSGEEDEEEEKVF